MSALPLIAGLPPDLQLYAGCKVRLTALDPTTGAFIPGVRMTNVSIFVRNAGGAAAPGVLDFGPFRLVPGPGA